MAVSIGTAGWAIPRVCADAFPGDGRHLQRYAGVLGCAEINSSFHRSHRVEVYERWAAQTPADFRFAVKLPKRITHEDRLRRARQPLLRFFAEAAGLGDRLAVLLVQLPPSFAFEPRPVRAFFGLLAELHGGAAAVVCEPRHASWFTPAADRLLAAARVARAAADPARCPGADRPGGWLGGNGKDSGEDSGKDSGKDSGEDSGKGSGKDSGKDSGDGAGALLYHRWHGAPRTYWSPYSDDWLAARAAELRRWPADADCWCIFDNTAAGAALPNALRLRALLAGATPAASSVAG